jgi:Na+-translocating ferredoxin:NAD+ oxidoreductase RnfD subunit
VPLAAGVFFFGWRALAVTGLSVGTCIALESLYYAVRRSPALFRSNTSRLCNGGGSKNI